MYARWITRRLCFSRQVFSMFNNISKAVLEAKLQVFLNGHFLESIDLHICIMPLNYLLNFNKMKNKLRFIIIMLYWFFDTYNSCRQIRINTRPKLVLNNFFLSFLCGL